MADFLRLFVALPLHREKCQALSALSGCFPLPALPARLALCRADTLHLTLVFLGDSPVSALPALKDEFQRMAAAHPPFDVIPTNLGGFPDAQKASILWFGYEKTPELSVLAQGIGQAIDGLGLTRDKKPFAPHLTLARVKGGHLSCREFPALTAAQKTAFGFRAERFTLFASHLGAQGVRHEAVAEFPLKG